MRDTLATINKMQTDGVIGKYAIGGAVGATLYLEPAATLDVGIFVTVPVVPGSFSLSLEPIYDYLKVRGGIVRDEHIVVGGWPFQFLPPSNELEREAVEQSVATDVEGTPTWVISAEHLVAIAVTTGRSKDHVRVLQFVEQEALKREKLEDILERHGLTAKWKQFERKYLDGAHG